MADFTVSQIQDTTVGGAQGPSGVQEPSPVTASLGFASDLFRTYASGAPARQAEAQAEQEALANQAVSRFSQQQIQIADAVDRGELTSQEARMRMRANYSQAISDNPQYTELFQETHSGIIGTAGLGKVAAEGTEQEQAFFKVQQDAASEGWVNDMMSAEEARQNTLAFQNFKREQQKIDALENELALKRAQVGLQTDIIQQGTARISQQTANLNLQQVQAQQQAQQALGSMANSYSTRILNKFNNLQRQAEAGEISIEEAVEQFDNEWLLVQNVAAQTGAQAGTGYVSNLIQPMAAIYEAKRGYLTGETDTATMEAIVDNAVARQVLQISGDPENVNIAAVSKVFGEASGTALALPITKKTLQLTQQNSDESRRPGDVTDPASSRDTETYINLVTDVINKANSGTLRDTEGSTQEINTNINQMMKALGTYGQMSDNPSDLNQAVSFFASDSYGRYMEGHGTGLNQDSQAQAEQVFQAMYSNSIRPLIQEEWANATQTVSVLGTSGVLGTTAEEVDTSEAIQPVFSGTGVRFVASEDFRSNARVRGKVEELNRRVAPTLNRLIKAGAHLSGTRDYQSVYESTYADLFGNEIEGEANDE